MRVFLLGFYGYDNIGDEVLLASILKSLGNAQYTFKVLSYNAKKTAAIHAVTAVSRSKNIRIIKQIAESDIIIVGGGSILQDITSSKSFFYYMSILIMGKMLGKRVYLLGNGFGPITKRFNQRLLKWFMPHIDGVIARDADAYQAYLNYGCKRVFNGVDCAFDYQPQLSENDSEQPFVAIALRPWQHSEQTMLVLQQYIVRLNQLGYRVKLVAMKAPDDVKQMQPLVEVGENTVAVAHDLNDVLAAIKDAKLLIGMRLHALILAAAMGTPVVAINYDPKIEGFMKQLLEREALDMRAISFAEIDARVMAILDHYEQEKAHLAKAVAHNRSIAKQQIEIIKQWMVE